METIHSKSMFSAHSNASQDDPDTPDTKSASASLVQPQLSLSSFESIGLDDSPMKRRGSEALSEEMAQTSFLTAKGSLCNSSAARLG